MDISIITPVYKGKKYLLRLLRNLERACKEIPQKRIEWIIINDYPEEKIICPKTLLNNLIIRYFCNNKNLGIHKSRVEGLKKATGKYVHFLDQDDKISKYFYKIQLNNISGFDACVSNGYVETGHNIKKEVFHSKKQMEVLDSIKYYFYIGDLIPSPGMVLIKKSSIPNEWYLNNLSVNGADDWLLWVFMLAQRCNFNKIIDCLYIHVDTGNNASKNKARMWDSTRSALKIFQNEMPNYSFLGQVFTRRINMICNFQLKGKNKLLEYLKNLDITFFLIDFKIWRRILK